MIQVGIAELKARLSEYLARVESGEDILIADRGRPVARLTQPNWGNPDVEDLRLLDLQRRGLVRLGTGEITDRLLEMDLPEDPQAEVRAALDTERAAGY